jgi:hypothetical protein
MAPFLTAPRILDLRAVRTGHRSPDLALCTNDLSVDGRALEAKTTIAKFEKLCKVALEGALR